MKEDPVPTLGSQDLYLFNEGSHTRLFEKLGAHLGTKDGRPGASFAVWAPNAEEVFVMGSFNGWNKRANRLEPVGESGIWAGFIPDLSSGVHYKYHIVSRLRGYQVDKADPVSFFNQIPPQTASIVWDLDYAWQDAEWMGARRAKNALDAPMSIYEVHLGSWKRVPPEGNRSLHYLELADELTAYVRKMGFTHVELMPVMDHPYFASWGYQSTGYFAASGRYGTPQELMALVDRLHQNGIGVILDWVPSHFPTDEHGLGFFDGTHLYEHADPRQGFHPDWKSFVFNYGRKEVQSFLLSSAMFWLEKYHADGLRVDGVASMLYLDYSRKEGDWIPNAFGGRENLEAIAFLRRFNEEVYRSHADTQSIAEESTSWPMVSRPTYVGGLGFGLKWDMGWMHDTLEYMAHDPIYRKFHHNEITFRQLYAWAENFVLPLSHDEVVHGKGSLLGKMPGDDWQRFANLRLLYAYMYGQSGKKLLFMGGEIGQRREWTHDGSVDWFILKYPFHAGVQRFVCDLNRLYAGEPALHVADTKPEGFEWVDCNDSEQSCLVFLRRGRATDPLFLVALNFTPVVRHGYRVGVPRGGRWEEALNSDSSHYGGSGQGNLGAVDASTTPCHGRPFSLALTLPPLGALYLKSPPHAE